MEVRKAQQRGDEMGSVEHIQRSEKGVTSRLDNKVESSILSVGDGKGVADWE